MKEKLFVFSLSFFNITHILNIGDDAYEGRNSRILPDEGQIHDGHVIDVETKQNGFVFSIDSYGECGGFCRIDSAQINRTVFEDFEEAKKHLR